MKKSKITKVTPNGSFESKFGKMYKFEVHFENGEYGDANCKAENQTTWVVGQEVSYTLTPNANPQFNGKLKKEEEGGGNGEGGKYQSKDSGVITMLSCISSACTAVSQGAKATDTAYIMTMANSFFDLAMSKKSS